jgi:tetratricopeptide (TPR) repeat protein
MNRRERRRQEKLGRKAAPPDATSPVTKAAQNSAETARVQMLREAATLRAAGKQDEAVLLYQSLLEINPDDTEAMYRLGMTRAAAGAVAEARDLLMRVVEIDPNFADGFSDLGVLSRRLGDTDAARAAYRKALALKPDHVDALYNSGNLENATGETEETASLYRRAIAARPGHQGALNNLGLLLHKKGDHEDAAEIYREALSHDDTLARTHNNLGNALRDSGALEQSLASYRRAIALDADLCDGWRNLSVGLQKMHLMEDAVDPARRALALEPDNPELLLNLGTLMIRLGQMKKGAEAYEAALAIRPDYADVHWNRAHVLLMHGFFQDGWREYEWRLRCPGLNAYGRTFDAPRWDGASLTGQRILIHSEQGFGDTLQFVRFLPQVRAQVKQKGGTVIFEAHKALIRLFDGIAGADVLVQAGDDMPPFDCYAPLLSLPFLFGVEEGSIPAAPALKVPSPPLIDLPESSNKRIGLVWAGRPQHGNDRNRSMTLSHLRPLLESDGCDFFSLQLGPARIQIEQENLHSSLTDLGDHLTDFAATAALIEQLDLVIAVDTAVAHLAGSLGKPVWLMLPFVPDWRWMLHRSDSPWYPTMRLFRQPVARNWAAAVEQAKTALAEFAKP